jgi:hypothetical protein
MATHGCFICSVCHRACPICDTCACSKTAQSYRKNDTLVSIFKNKLEETDRERAAQELAYAQSSDYSSPPSMRVARLEGQVSMLKWVIEVLEKR